MVHEEISRALHKGLQSKNCKPLKVQQNQKVSKNRRSSLRNEKGRINERFASVFTEGNLRVSLPFLLKADKSEVLQQMMENRIFLDLSTKLNVSKSPGPESIHPRRPKKLKGEIWNCS